MEKASPGNVRGDLPTKFRGESYKHLAWQKIPRAEEDGRNIQKSDYKRCGHRDVRCIGNYRKRAIRGAKDLDKKFNRLLRKD